MHERISVFPANAVPFVSNENLAGRTGDTAPYFANKVVTYACVTGYIPFAPSIEATCTAGTPPKWTGPANADTVCRPGKTYFFYYYISFLQSEHKTIMKTALIAEDFDETKLSFQTFCTSLNNPFYSLFYYYLDKTKIMVVLVLKII